MIAKYGTKILALAGCLVVMVAVGLYALSLQAQELDRVDKAVKVAEMKQAELTSLLQNEAASTEEARHVVQRWYARYKSIPDTLSNPEVVGFMNDLTRSGFENFDVTFSGQNGTADYSYYSYSVNGRGYFNSLYRFVWAVENSRNLYRLRNLKLDHIDLVKTERNTERERMQVMVSFSFTLDAYFGGAEGLSAPDGNFVTGFEANGTPLTQAFTLPPIPKNVLPREAPYLNPFFPIIMAQLPPNTYGRVDVEEAPLLAITGGKAIFEKDGAFVALGAGDAVYLGRITGVDPVAGRVVARLNKGGIIDDVEVHLQTGERYQQAVGAAQVAPIEDPE